MVEFKWHEMADEQPTKRNVDYLLLGKRNALYIGSLESRKDGKTYFYVRNNRSPFFDFENVKAWAEIPAHTGEEE